MHGAEEMGSRRHATVGGMGFLDFARNDVRGHLGGAQVGNADWSLCDRTYAYQSRRLGVIPLLVHCGSVFDAIAGGVHEEEVEVVCDLADDIGVGCVESLAVQGKGRSGV